MKYFVYKLQSKNVCFARQDMSQFEYEFLINIGAIEIPPSCIQKIYSTTDIDAMHNYQDIPWTLPWPMPIAIVMPRQKH